MNKYVTLIATTGALLLSSACSTTPTRLGSVADATVTDLRLCFRSDAVPSAGQEVQILRREAVGGSKPPLTYMSRNVGTARVTASASDHCVPATLITGAARRHDGAQWPGGESPR